VRTFAVEQCKGMYGHPFFPGGKKHVSVASVLRAAK